MPRITHFGDDSSGRKKKNSMVASFGEGGDGSKKWISSYGAPYYRANTVVMVLAILWARDKISNPAYGPKNSLNLFWPDGVNKCNKFVVDAFNKGNKRTIIDDGIRGTSPPTAADFYNGRVPGFEISRDANIGYIAATTSHVGIVSGDNKTISASSKENRVVENDWGFRENEREIVRFYRYIGE